jgi:lysine-specific demethylase 8
MGKFGYFIVAIFVGGLALAVYFIEIEHLFGKVVKYQQPLKTEDKMLHSKSVSPEDDRQEPQDEPKTNTKQSTKPIQTQQQSSDGQPADKGHPADKSSQPPPPGHLKKLGEHGAPVIEGFVEELDYVLYGKDFYDHFIRKRTPVVLRGAAKEWPAFLHWSNETYLKAKYGKEQHDIEFTKNYENIPPIKKTMSLKEFLEIYKKEEVYLDSPIPHSSMTQDIIVPTCLQCKEILSSIQSIHLLYSNGGTSSSFHQDGYENLLTVFSGRKEVLLAHYNNSKYLYSKNQKHQTYVGLASLKPEAVDLLAFPHLANMTFYKVQVPD